MGILLKINCFRFLTAAIAQWIRLRLPICGPGFISHAPHLCYYSQKITELRKGQKEVGFDPKQFMNSNLDTQIPHNYLVSKNVEKNEI